MGLHLSIRIMKTTKMWAIGMSQVQDNYEYRDEDGDHPCSLRVSCGIDKGSV